MYFSSKQINKIKKTFYNKYKRYINMYIHHKINMDEISYKFSNMLSTIDALHISVDKYIIQDMMFYIQSNSIIKKIKLN